MAQMGHVIIGVKDEFVSLDAGFCAMMRAEAKDMIGRKVLDVTAAADRAACANAIMKLRATLKPFRISKRFVRDDGSMLWVSNSVSITGHGDSPFLIVATIVPIADPDAHSSPGQLLSYAKLLYASRRNRHLAFDDTLFSDPAWDIFLAAYIAEAEGRPLNLATLAASAQISAATAERWIRLLVQRNLLEMESTVRPGAGAEDAFRLSGDAHARFESYLAGLTLKHLSPA